MTRYERQAQETGAGGADPVPQGARVAVVGAGVAGLAAAHRLTQAGCHVTLLEAGATLGGHAHTVDVTLPDAQGKPVTHGVDTGFLVMNERTYPGMLGLLDELGVPKAPSDMSFSVQSPHGRGQGRLLEWSGSSLDTVFAQRSNLWSPSFWRMLADIVRFNAEATALAQSEGDARLAWPLSRLLAESGYSEAFKQGYFLPMLGCIWSCPTEQMLAFPVATMVRFCHNHGLLQIANRPQWYTVAGGSREYVRRIAQGVSDVRVSTPVLGLRRTDAGVSLAMPHAIESFDAVVLACHTDQSLDILGTQASSLERQVLGAIRYQRNVAVLHTDASVMPTRRKAWAAWNYERSAHASQEQAQVCLHYWINQLQPLPFAQPVIVSLNPVREIDPAKVLGRYDYAHPVFDQAAIDAQAQLPRLQGQAGVWFAGAWTGYGFHEDGYQSGVKAAQDVLAQLRMRAQGQANASTATTEYTSQQAHAEGSHHASQAQAA